MRFAATLALLMCAAAAPAPRSAPEEALPSRWSSALAQISAEAMRGRVSFLASDLLEGRDTPSRGLDIAAEYIASEFRRAGLEQPIKGTYLQIGTVKRDASDAHASNVAAILRGSDPKLSNTYVVLSAHYDHLGMLPDNAGGDRIDNGANDNASGVVSMIEIAAALSQAKVHPRRSILFLAFYGEEEGFLGSKFFLEHPLVPLASIVAQINLEQLGRTDDDAGPQIHRAGVTGIDYSDVGRILQSAGRSTGIEVHGDYEDPDEYFERSDNLPFAKAGIPAHTVGVAFEFPDYHQPGDEWQKIDYRNMADVDRMIAAAVIMLADSSAVPQWNPASPYQKPGG